MHKNFFLFIMVITAFSFINEGAEACYADAYAKCVKEQCGNSNVGCEIGCAAAAETECL